MVETIKPPNREVIENVSKILNQRNVFVTDENLEVVIAATCHWLENSKRGLEYMAYLLQLDCFSGRNENKYIEKDGFGRLTKEIKAESIIFLRGCIVKGEAYPISQIDIQTRDSTYCEECGAETICAKALLLPYGEKTVCSHCASASEIQSARDSFDQNCTTCTYVGCSWHPVNIDAPPFEDCV